MASGNAGMDRLSCRPVVRTRACFRSPDARAGSSGGVSCARGVPIFPADSPVFAPRSGSQPYFPVAVGYGTSVSRKHTTSRLRMAHVTCHSVPAQRQKTHPVTWVVTAAIVPLLCWDAWQTYREARLKMSVEVKLGHAPRESGHVPRLDEQLPDYVSVVRAWMRAGEDARVRSTQLARPLAENAQSEAAQGAAIRELPYLQ
jgi:hypothetical protein